jgi:predicted porin
VLTLSGSYTKVSSNSVQNEIGTFNNGERYDARLTVRMRRLYLIAGYDRAMQESSVVPGGRQKVNSYYVSLSRWFNVF